MVGPLLIEVEIQVDFVVLKGERIVVLLFRTVFKSFDLVVCPGRRGWWRVVVPWCSDGVWRDISISQRLRGHIGFGQRIGRDVLAARGWSGIRLISRRWRYSELFWNHISISPFDRVGDHGRLVVLVVGAHETVRISVVDMFGPSEVSWKPLSCQ